jgi:protein SOK2
MAGRHRVTTTLWEDEGTLCFQVDARGVCVARRHGEQWRGAA